MLFGLFTTFLIVFIIGLVVWKIFKKFKFLKNRKPLKIAVTVICTILIYISACLIMIIAFSYERNIDFNEETWKNKVAERSKMIEDLIHSDYFIDKNMDEIREVFGKPYKVNTNKNSVTYILRKNHGFIDIKLVFLELKLKDSIVESYDFKIKIVD